MNGGNIENTFLFFGSKETSLTFTSLTRELAFLSRLHVTKTAVPTCIFLVFIPLYVQHPININTNQISDRFPYPHHPHSLHWPKPDPPRVYDQCQSWVRLF